MNQSLIKYTLALKYTFDAISRCGNVSALMAWWTSGYIEERRINELRT